MSWRNRVTAAAAGCVLASKCTEASGRYGDDPLEPVVGWVSTGVRC